MLSTIPPRIALLERIREILTTSRKSRALIPLAALLAMWACSARQSLPTAGTDAATRYVQASAGSDANDGSAAHPYRTIGKCATTATRGQTCAIRAGIYREILKPNSGVTIRSEGGIVTLLATDRVAGWKRSAGSIYVAHVTINPHLAASQVFIGPTTTLVNEAQWPVPSNDPMHPNWAVERAGSTRTTIVDPTLPTSDLAGAIVNVWSGTDPWTHVTGPVTSAGGGTHHVRAGRRRLPVLLFDAARLVLRHRRARVTSRAKRVVVRRARPPPVPVGAEERRSEQTRRRSQTAADRDRPARAQRRHHPQHRHRRRRHRDGRAQPRQRPRRHRRALHFVGNAFAGKRVLQLRQLPARERHRARGNAQYPWKTARSRTVRRAACC